MGGESEAQGEEGGTESQLVSKQENLDVNQGGGLTLELTHFTTKYTTFFIGSLWRINKINKNMSYKA